VSLSGICDGESFGPGSFNAWGATALVLGGGGGGLLGLQAFSTTIVNIKSAFNLTFISIVL
jgi:hypothetical protein